MKKLLGLTKNIVNFTAKEYEASINSLNIFFGAVIGVSLGNVEDISTENYIQLLLPTTAAVMAILFITYSERLLMSLLTVVIILGAIWWTGYAEESAFNFPPKLFPTLAVWAALALFTEFWKVIAGSKS